MTKQMMTKQIFELCDGKLNRSQMTQAEFKQELKPYGVTWFSINLPDGDWLMRVTHSQKWGWEYDIPINETQQEYFEELYMESYHNNSGI